MRFLPNFTICLLTATFWSACSTSTASSVDEDDDAESSSSVLKSSSSAQSSSSNSDKVSEPTDKDSESSNQVTEPAEVIGEDCVGEPGNPWDGTTAKEFACGSGTKLSPYVILTAEQLAHLSFVIGAKDKDYLEKYYKLGADIILNDGKIIDDKGALVADSAKLHKWTSIGNSSVAFAGNFDGDGHSVSGMFINTTSSYNGLFGNSSGTIQNLTVENGWVYGGKYTAGVVGYSVGSALDLLNKVSVSGKDECYGGVIGSSARKDYKYNSVIKNASNAGVIAGYKNVGGVAGCATYVTASGLENAAYVEGYGYVGGVLGGIGRATENDIQNLKNEGKVTGTHFVGGVAGHCGGLLTIYTSDSPSTYSCANYSTYACGSFKNSKNIANVEGKRFVGGISGLVCGAEMDNLANTADVVGEYGVGGIVSSINYSTTKSVYNVGDIYGSEYVGGIFGYNKEGVTSSAYSTGKVDGDTLVGLMIGSNYNTTMADYYYLKQGDQEPFGLNNSGGVATSKTAEEMKSEEFAKLLGEDFKYDSGLNDGYPVLEWDME